MVETADGVAVAMQGAGEALRVVADGIPSGGIGLGSHIAAQDEVQLVAAAYTLVQRGVVGHDSAILEAAAGNLHGVSGRLILLVMEREVVEVAQQVELALVHVRGRLVVDVDLGITSVHTVQAGMIDIEVVVLLAHHAVDVVIVGHRDLHGV